MADVEMFAEEEHHPENPLNREEENIRDGEIRVELNDSQDNKFESQRTAKELRSELRKFKEDNEWILKAREELNAILLAKIHNDEKEKNRESEQEMPKGAPSKCKGRKLDFSGHKYDTSSDESVKHHMKQQDSSESSDDNKKKKK